ncbi:MAG: hypothetical protein ACREOI_03665 [bacterium]
MPVQATDKFILYSGGAVGADTLFGTNAQWYGVTEQNYSFRGDKNCRSRGRIILDEAQLKLADEDLLAAIGNAFKKHQGTGGSSEKYWQRNWHQVQKAREIFAVVKDAKTFLDFAKTRIEGAGIGIAVAIKTKTACKRIYVYDQTLGNWWIWKRNSDHWEIEVNYRKTDINTTREIGEKLYFEEIEEDQVKIIETDFAGIGTREINSLGIETVNSLFKRSF